MVASGFVLAGGKSSRMGQDKALLPYRGTTLVEQVARVVREAVGCVAIIGAPDRYASLGYPVHPDVVAECGPLGGIYTALSLSATDWNLVVACDMPRLSADNLRRLLDGAQESAANCLMAKGASGEPEPLCGVYHRRCLPALNRAILDKRFRMRDLVPELKVEIVALGEPALANVNTPADWTEYGGETG